MFIKTTRSGGHSYVQLVESYRNEEGKPRQRTVATLGRLDEIGGGVDSLLAGLTRPRYRSNPRWRWAMCGHSINCGKSLALIPWQASFDARATPHPWNMPSV